MATVFKRTRRKPVPQGAEIIESRGNRHAVWTSRGGRKRKAPLADEGQSVLVRDENYTVSWWSWDGKRKKLCGGPDKDAAEALGARMEALEMQRRRGILEPRQERVSQEARRPIDQHLANYEAKLRAANRTGDYVDRSLGFIRAIAAAAGFAKVSDITDDGVNAYAAELGKKRSARTVQAHLTAIKGFTRWLAVNGKLPTDPLASVKKPSPKTDRRRQRRMLLPEEWEWLRTVTLSDNVEREGTEARERVLLYATAIQTGLRSSELRSLTRGRLYLAGTLPYITCKAGSTKNKKDARQYVQPDLAAELHVHVSRKAPGTPVFAMPSVYDVAAVLRADLDAARREWLKAAENDPDQRLRREQSDFLAVVNHEGEVLDFHGLRHTCGAWLAMTGAHPNEIKAVMRHSVITLTMDTYGHLFPGQEADTVARLPVMLGNTPEIMRATGTCDAAAVDGTDNGAGIGAAIGAAVGVAVKRQNVAREVPNRRNVDSGPTDEDSPQLLTLARDENTRRVVTNGRGETRTRTSLTGNGILSPVRLPIPPLGQVIICQ